MMGTKAPKLMASVALMAVQVGYSQTAVEYNGWIVFGIIAVAVCLGYFAGDDI